MVTHVLAVYSSILIGENIRMKAILFSFVRSFDFELAVPPSQITRKTMVVTRPFLASDPDSGAQMPLIIQPARSD